MQIIILLLLSYSSSSSTATVLFPLIVEDGSLEDNDDIHERLLMRDDVYYED